MYCWNQLAFLKLYEHEVSQQLRRQVFLLIIALFTTRELFNAFFLLFIFLAFFFIFFSHSDESDENNELFESFFFVPSYIFCNDQERSHDFWSRKFITMVIKGIKLHHSSFVSISTSVSLMRLLWENCHSTITSRLNYGRKFKKKKKLFKFQWNALNYFFLFNKHS